MKILVIGGTEFMGRALIPELLKLKYEVVTLNRGNEYWGTKDPFGQQVEKIYCDRKNTQQFRKVLQDIKKDEFEAVIDFCAYKPKHILPCVELLTGKIKNYIFISTDSVYMVSVPPSHNGFIKESDAIRPNEPEEVEKLKKKDKYGHNKLLCEEFLYNSSNFPFTCLRLPDVFGPFDTSDRHWKYQLWLKVCSKHPIDLSENGRNRKLGFIYSYDVASVIIQILHSSSKDLVLRKSFNISQNETPSLQEYLQMMGNILNIDPKFRYVNENEKGTSDSGSEDSIEEYLPSVDFGPIDNSLALKTFPNWKPTKLYDALKDTCLFFEKSFLNFPSLRPIHDFNEEMKRDIELAYLSDKK